MVRQPDYYLREGKHLIGSQLTSGGKCDDGSLDLLCWYVSRVHHVKCYQHTHPRRNTVVSLSLLRTLKLNASLHFLLACPSRGVCLAERSPPPFRPTSRLPLPPFRIKADANARSRWGKREMDAVRVYVFLFHTTLLSCSTLTHPFY